MKQIATLIIITLLAGCTLPVSNNAVLLLDQVKVETEATLKSYLKTLAAYDSAHRKVVEFEVAAYRKATIAKALKDPEIKALFATISDADLPAFHAKMIETVIEATGKRREELLAPLQEKMAELTAAVKEKYRGISEATTAVGDFLRSISKVKASAAEIGKILTSTELLDAIRKIKGAEKYIGLIEEAVKK